MMTPAIALFLLPFALSSPAASLPAAGPMDQDPAALVERLGRGAVTMRTALDLWRVARLEDRAAGPARARLLQALARVAEARGGPLAVRRLAARMLASRLRGAGRAGQARRYQAGQGFLRDWWVIGPFDNEGFRGFEHAFAPEERIQLDAVLQGKRSTVRWRRHPVRSQDGLVLLHPLFMPAEKAVAYGLCLARTRRPRHVLLHAGCDDACRVWIDDVLVLSDSGQHALAPDQHTISMRLPAGTHRILVKTAQSEGNWGFALALTDRRGRPLDDLENPTSRSGLREALAAPRPAPPTQVTARPSLARWFIDRIDERNPRKLIEAALALVHTRTDDLRRQRASDLARRAVGALQTGQAGEVDILLQAAAVVDDPDMSEQWLERAAGLAPDRTDIWNRLSVARHIRGCWASALAANHRALQAEPHDPAALLERAELLQRLRLNGLAIRLLEATTARFPDVPEVLGTAANLYRRAGWNHRARELFAQLVAIRVDDPLGLRALFELDLAGGEIDRALAWLDRLLEREPLRIGWWIERGDLLLHNGRAAEATTAYQRAIDICPEHSLALVRQGDALLALGRTEECLKQWNQAAALSPQDRDLERRIEQLQPRGEMFYRPWVIDAANLPRGEVDCSAGGTVRLHDRTVVELHSNGMTSRYRQQVVEVLDARGADRMRSHSIEYAPSRQQIRILQSRVLRADGTEDAGVVVDDHSLSEPWYNLYYDIHARVITFPTLGPGDRIELSYQIDDVGGSTLLGAYFGDLVPFQFDHPARYVSYVLLAPAGYPLYFNTPRGAQHRLANHDDGMVVHTWEARQVAAVESEPDMPGFTETHAILHVSSHHDWPELARWYQDQIRDQLVAGPELKRLATSLTRRAGSTREKIRALYRYVADGTRYVGLEFGIHSYVPYRTGQVLQRKFGDCKDKSSLLVALLREAGIPARIALLRMRRLGNIPSHPASLAVFNHAVVYVPGEELWLDATVSFHDILAPPPQDQGVPALVIEPDGGRLITTSTTSSRHNRTRIHFDVAPEPGGNARVDARVEVTGTLAPAIRAQLAGSSTRKAAVEKIMNELFPGARVTSLSIDNLQRPDRPLSLSTGLRVTVTSASGTQDVELPVLGRITNYQKIFAPYGQRRHDLLLAPPWSVHWSLTFTPPRGHRTAGLPAGGTVETAFGSARLRVRQEGGQVVVEASFRLDRGRIDASAYTAFRAFLGDVDRLFASRVCFERVADAKS